MMARRILFRVLVALVLVSSPVTFPAALLITGEPITFDALRELYRDAWKVFVRGFA